jgi:DNA-binding NarL/FixJ family response regulator
MELIPDSVQHRADSLPASLRTVLVVEDFTPFRRVICSILASRAHLQVVGEAADGSIAVQKAQELKPDLILLDIGLPTLDGLECARRIRLLANDSRIIFVSQESSADVVEEALKLGSAYVPKTKIASELLAAVESVLTGNLVDWNHLVDVAT